MKMNSNTILIILTACIVAGGAYYYISENIQNEEPIAAGVPISESQLEFQTLVTQLQPVDFDPTILTDPRFLSLRSITTIPTPEDYGRSDPFAQIGGSSAR